LYMVQGLPHGFFGQAMPVLLREQGMSLRDIGLMSLVALPWALKFLWSPWLDRTTLWRGEHRRSWIFAMNLSAACMLLLLSFFPLSSLVGSGVLTMGVALLVINILIATQDISVDAMAVENLSVKERGIGNGIQVAGYRTGMVIAGGALVSAFSYIGWQAALWILAGLMVLGTLPLCWWQPRQHAPLKQPVWQAFKGFFTLRHAVIWVLMVLFYKFGDAFGSQMLRPYLSDIGVTLPQMGLLLGTGGFIAGLVGALLGGWLAGKWPRSLALSVFLVIEALAMGSYAFAGQASLNQLWGLVVFEHVAGGMATAGLFTVMMDRCRVGSEGSDYALQSCMVIVAGMLAGSLSGISAEALGYTQHLVIAGGMCLLAVPLVLLAQRQALFLAVKADL
ncbi:MAG: MFS transporter, partial [Oleibacter sp.]|nr:MFS transporter [Thalassolituus sp.]